MSTFVLVAVLFGAVMHASWNALIKGRPDKFLAALLVAIGAGVAGLPVMLAYSPPAAEAWPYIAASAVVHVIYFGLVGLAYRTADLGVAYPLTRGSAPLFTAIFAYLLIGEALGPQGWSAVIAIAVGIAALSADALLRGGLNRATALVAFLNAGMIVLYTLIDGLGARVTGNAPLYTAWMCFAAAVMELVILLAFRKNFLSEVKVGWPLGLLGGVLTLGSYAISTWAMTRAPIGVVASLRETSVLFAAILGAVLFKEPFGVKRVLALALIVGGIVALRLAGPDSP